MMPSIFATVGDAASACPSSTPQSAKTGDETTGAPLFADVMGSLLTNGPAPAKPARPASAGAAADSEGEEQPDTGVARSTSPETEVAVAESPETTASVVTGSQTPQTGTFFFGGPLTRPLVMDIAGGELAGTGVAQGVEGAEDGTDQTEVLQETADGKRMPRTITGRHQRGLRDAAMRNELADTGNSASSCLLSDADADETGSEAGTLTGPNIAMVVKNLLIQPPVGNPAMACERPSFIETNAKPSASAPATSPEMAVAPAASPLAQRTESSQITPWSPVTNNEQQATTDAPTQDPESPAPLAALSTSENAADSTETRRSVVVRETDLPNTMPEGAQPEPDAQVTSAQLPSPQTVGDGIREGYDTAAQRAKPGPGMGADQVSALADSQWTWTPLPQSVVDQTMYSESVRPGSSDASAPLAVPAAAVFSFGANVVVTKPLRGLSPLVDGQPATNASAPLAVPAETAFSFGANVVVTKPLQGLSSLVDGQSTTLPENQGLGISQYQVSDLTTPTVAGAQPVFPQKVTRLDLQPASIQQLSDLQPQPAAIPATSVELPGASTDPRFQSNLSVTSDSAASVRQNLPAATGEQPVVSQGTVVTGVPEPPEDMAGEEALRGTDAAPNGVAMKKPNDLHTIAGPDENILPVEKESEFLWQHQREPFGVKIGEKLEHSVLDGLFVTHEPETGRQQLISVVADTTPDATSTSATAAFSVESLADQLMDRVVKFKSLYQDNVAVMVAPDDKTEIHLQFTLAGDGVNVCARVERGDFNVLQANWDQLRQTLADHGVHMGELNRTASDTNYPSQSSTETTGSGAREQAPHHKPRLSEELADEIAGAGAMTETPHIRLHNARRVTPRRWEKWA